MPSRSLDSIARRYSWYVLAPRFPLSFDIEPPDIMGMFIVHDKFIWVHVHCSFFCAMMGIFADEVGVELDSRMAGLVHGMEVPDSGLG
jgi:hypothetical protein